MHSNNMCCIGDELKLKSIVYLTVIASPIGAASALPAIQPIIAGKQTNKQETEVGSQ